MTSIPLKNFSHVIPGIIAGSAAPDIEANPDVVDYITKHFRSFVTLRAETAELDIKQQLNENNVKTFRIPMVDRAIPTMEQYSQFEEIMSDESNYPILVACKGGYGRTAAILCCGFIYLWCRGDEPSRSFPNHINNNSISNNNNNNNNRSFAFTSSSNLQTLIQPPLTGQKLLDYLKQNRSVNFPVEAVDELIARSKIAKWNSMAKLFAPWCSTAEASLYDQPHLKNFRQIIPGCVGTAALPGSKFSGEDLVASLQEHGYKTIINAEVESRRSRFTQEQKDALEKNNINLINITIPPSDGPTMEQVRQAAEIFLDKKKNWPILVTSQSRGRSGSIICAGVIALRRAREPFFMSVGTSANDAIEYVRSHLGPFCIDAVEQERVLNRYVNSLRLYNFNTVLENSGIINYAAISPDADPTSVWLTLQRRGGASVFSTVVSFTEKPLLAGDFLKNKKGISYHHIKCKPGLVPSSQKDLHEKFGKEIVSNCSSWPLLIVSDNGYARSMFASAIAVCYLVGNKDLMSKFGSMLFPRSSSSATSATSEQIEGSSSSSFENSLNSPKELIQTLVQNHEGDGATLSQISSVQISTVVDTAKRLLAGKSCLISDEEDGGDGEKKTSSASATSSSSTTNIPSSTPNWKPYDGGEDNDGEETVLKLLAWGDFGANLDSPEKIAATQKFGAQIANEVRTNGRPSYILLLGDLQYWSGSSQLHNDPGYTKNFLEAFLSHKELHHIPFKINAGNHDWRNCPRKHPKTGDPEPISIDFTSLGHDENPNQQWQFCGNDSSVPPNRYYSFRHPSKPLNERSPTELTPEQAESAEKLPDSEKVFIGQIDLNVSQARTRRDFPHVIKNWAEEDRKWIISELEQAQECLWRIVFSHQPMYTQCLGHEVEAVVLREGMTLPSGSQILPFEPILNDLNVELYCAGHEHSGHLKIRGKNDVIHVVSGNSMCWETYGKTNPAADLHRCDWEADRGCIGFTRIFVTKNKKAKTTRLIVEMVRAEDLKVLHRVVKVKNLVSTSEDEDIITGGGMVRTDSILSQTETTQIEKVCEGQSQTSTSSAASTTSTTSTTRAVARKIPPVPMNALYQRPAVIIVDYPSMLETLTPVVESLKQIASVFTFTNTAASMEAAALLLKRKVPIAAIVSNMRRKRENSGIKLMEKFNDLCHQHNLDYFVPRIMFSHTANKNPEPSFLSGASIIFSTRVDRLKSVLFAVVEASRWCRRAREIQTRAAITSSSSDSSSSSSSSSLLLFDAETNKLRLDHCLTPLLAAEGGRIENYKVQQLLFTAQCAAFEKLSKPISRAIVEEATTFGVDENGFFGSGETAVHYWSHVARNNDDEDTRGRCRCFELKVSRREAIVPLAMRILTIVVAFADPIRGYLSHASCRTNPSSGFENFVSLSKRIIPKVPKSQQKEDEEEAIVEIKFTTVGGIRLAIDENNSSNENNDIFSWEIARVRYSSIKDVNMTYQKAGLIQKGGDEEEESSSASASASQKVAAVSDYSFSNEYSNTFEISSNQTRFCGGLLMSNPESTLVQLQNEKTKSSSQHAVQRIELLEKLMKEIILKLKKQ